MLNAHLVVFGVPFGSFYRSLSVQLLFSRGNGLITMILSPGTNKGSSRSLKGYFI
jgi:hypothetical protein